MYISVVQGKWFEKRNKQVEWDGDVDGVEGKWETRIVNLGSHLIGAGRREMEIAKHAKLAFFTHDLSNSILFRNDLQTTNNPIYSSL